MKVCVVLAFAGLATRFVVPAVAQDQNTVDPEVRQQIEATPRSFTRHITSMTPLL